MGVLDEFTVVQYLTFRARVLNQHPTNVIGRVVKVLEVGDSDLDIKPLGPGLADVDGLRVAIGGDKKGLLFAFLDVVAHGHGLGGSGALVEKGSVGHGEGGEVGYHGLEVEEGLEAALGYLGLVGGVLGVPGRVLHDVPEDDGGDRGVVVAHPDEGLEDLVLRGKAAHVRDHLGLSETAVELCELHVGDADGFGNGGIDEGVKRTEAAGGGHGGLLLGRGGVMAAGERIRGEEEEEKDELCLRCSSLSLAS